MLCRGQSVDRRATGIPLFNVVGAELLHSQAVTVWFIWEVSCCQLYTALQKQFFNFKLHRPTIVFGRWQWRWLRLRVTLVDSGSAKRKSCCKTSAVHHMESVFPTQLSYLTPYSFMPFYILKSYRFQHDKLPLFNKRSRRFTRGWIENFAGLAISRTISGKPKFLFHQTRPHAKRKNLDPALGCCLHLCCRRHILQLILTV